jgi:hypothetical protein
VTVGIKVLKQSFTSEFEISRDADFEYFRKEFPTVQLSTLFPHSSHRLIIIIVFLMSMNAGGMRELYVFDSTYVLKAQYMLPMKAGGRTGIDIQSLTPRFCDAFVNIDVTTPKGCSTTVDVLLYKYVVTLLISF